MPRMVSCSRCGRIHPAGQCSRPAPRAPKKNREPNKFRSTWAWTQKSLEIRERDHYMCQACFFGLDGCGQRINTENLSVHHIRPLREAPEKKLDGRNLITLCDEHHEQAEEGKFDNEVLAAIARAREEGREPFDES